MSEEIQIEEMRRELGRDMAQKGEPLHEGASEEFVRGYSSWAGSSNVMPRKFGKGGAESKEWTCICGYSNPRYIKKRCYLCGVEKTVSDQAK